MLCFTPESVVKLETEYLGRAPGIMKMISYKTIFSILFGANLPDVMIVFINTECNTISSCIYSKKDAKESILSSTTSDPGHHMGKCQNHN